MKTDSLNTVKKLLGAGMSERCEMQPWNDVLAVQFQIPHLNCWSTWRWAVPQSARCEPCVGWLKDSTGNDPALLSAASRIAWGFRTLYNQHDTVALLRHETDDRYWHSAITYAARNNLQAVLDEYVHCLVEAEGLIDAEPRRRVSELACAVGRAISLLPSQTRGRRPAGSFRPASYRQVRHARPLCHAACGLSRRRRFCGPLERCA